MPIGRNINGRIYSNTAFTDMILKMKDRTIKFDNVELLGELCHPSRNWSSNPNEISISFTYENWYPYDSEALLATHRKKVNLNFKN